MKRALKTDTSPRLRRPAVGIIGGGIFGTTCALFLGRYCTVTIFEQADDILSGASYANQYRHHAGYHYPRSTETIREITSAAAAFKRFYGSVIDSSFPSFYCINRIGSRVTAREFLNVCNRMKLPYTVAYPPEGFLDRTAVDVCLKTPEAAYDYGKLQALIRKRIRDNGNITLRVRHSVIGAMRCGAVKVLTISHQGAVEEHVFDYVINATYARYNDFCAWLHFPPRRLEFRFKELLVIRVPTRARTAVTIMDGPFATLVPIPGSRNLYTLGDVPLSIHKKTAAARSASASKWRRPKSRRRLMLKRCLRWFPVLKRARYLRSLFVVLPIDRASTESDARPTEVTYHGFGCWSILSGKIITAVVAAKKITAAIRQMEKKRKS